MRSDPARGGQIRGYEAFESSIRDAARSYWGHGFGRDSLSGKEPNRFFLNNGGKQFSDLSGLSGLDHIGDGRALALLDYDRDGWQDLAVVNANAPKLTLFHNELGALVEDRRSLAVRLVGGNTTAAATAQWSNRDGIGARITAEVAGRTITRHVQVGEGFSAQNSNTMLVALGEQPSLAKLVVHWPSGKTQSVADLTAGTLTTIFEDRAKAADSGGDAATGVVRAPYRLSQRDDDKR